MLSTSTRTLGFLFLVQSLIGLKVYNTQKTTLRKVFDVFCHCACLLEVFSKWSCFKGQWSLPQISRVDFVFVIVNVYWLVMSCLIITLIKCLKKVKSIKDCSENVYYKSVCAQMWLIVIMLERYKAVLIKIKIKIVFFVLSCSMTSCSSL